MKKRQRKKDKCKEIYERQKEQLRNDEQQKESRNSLTKERAV